MPGAFKGNFQAELKVVSGTNKLLETDIFQLLPQPTTTIKHIGNQHVMTKFTLQTVFGIPSPHQVQAIVIDLLYKAAHQEFRRVLAEELLPLAQSQKHISKMSDGKKLTIFISYAWASQEHYPNSCVPSVAAHSQN